MGITVGEDDPVSVLLPETDLPGSAKHWIIPEIDLCGVEALAAELQCPSAIAALLIQCNIADKTAAHAFFEPTLNDLHDPALLLGMPEAVARIQQAVAASEPILIYGDYDVDGTTAIVLLKTAIERIAGPDHPAIVSYHVPHRIREGYGMQTNILADAAVLGTKLVISVDTGIRAFAAAEQAEELGLDLIVTDHHLPDDSAGVPKALAVINPAQAQCAYPFKFLCGAAVAFKLSHALLLSAAKTNEDHIRLTTKLLPSFLKLVAIATIADSVPLIGENRVIAMLGLEQLKNPVQPGLKALMQVAQIPSDRSPTANEVGFRIAPRINAAGRMDVANDVIDLFLTRDSRRASELAQRLDSLNSDRRAAEAQALEVIDEQLAAMKEMSEEYPAECLVLDHPGWHRGIVGILASRVVDRTGRPALVVTHDDGQAHGSGRSIGGFHLLDALTAVHASVDENAPEPLFTRFGGHAHAVGFSLSSERISCLRARMRSYTRTRLAAPLCGVRLICSQEIPISDITGELHEWLARCAPFGNSNAEPIFVSTGVLLCSDPRIIKEKHICLSLEQRPAVAISALGWSRTTDWVDRCKKLSLSAGSRLDLAYHIRRGSSMQFGNLELELRGLWNSSVHICQAS